MATKIHMEALSPTMEEGQVVRWLKQEGESVEEGDVLAEIETDKATMELVARGSGVLRKQLVAAGATKPVGEVIGVIAGADEDISTLLPSADSGAAAAEAPCQERPAARQPGAPEEAIAEASVQAAPPRQPVQASAAGGPPSVAAGPVEPQEGERAGPAEPSQRDDGRTRASPLARRLAADAGVALRDVRGSGPGGRITKRDIEAALERAPAAEAPAGRAMGAAAGAPAQRVRPLAAEVEEVPVSQMRKTIAKRLVTSIGPVPTFYLTVDVDAERLASARQRINAHLESTGEKVSINDLIIKLTAAALVRHPEVNASWDERVIRRYGRVHIGVAVAIADGLITPVVRDADAKGVAQIAREVKDLAARARDKKLTPEEYTGATFSISNLGMFGIEEFTAIINPPEAAILAVGQIEDKPVAHTGQLVIRPRMRVTMSCDHRVVDGATGARFLQTLKGFLEDPALTLV